MQTWKQAVIKLKPLIDGDSCCLASLQGHLYSLVERKSGIIPPRLISRTRLGFSNKESVADRLICTHPQFSTCGIRDTIWATIQQIRRYSNGVIQSIDLKNQTNWALSFTRKLGVILHNYAMNRLLFLCVGIDLLILSQLI